MKSLIDKYKPKSSSEIPQDLSRLKDSIKNKRPVLLYGQSGSCKTSSVYAIANELNYEILELNASDLRNKEQIESIIGQALNQKSLFNREKIILLDEIDGLSGTDDRGGASALSRLLENNNHALVMTCNEVTSEKLKEIKKLALTIEFKPITNTILINLIKNICIKENINHKEEDLKKIIVNSNGDVRAAINDLESCTDNKILDVSNLHSREYETNIYNALSTVFKTKSITSIKALENLNIDLNEYSLWLDENLPLEYKNPDDLEKAYYYFSKADIFKSRIIRWQHWRFMYFQSLFLTSGISLAKEKPYTTFIPYKRTMRLLKIWQYNMKHGRKKSISEKIAKTTHSAIKEVIKNFNYYKSFINNKQIINELKLTEEEIEYLNK